MTIMGTGGLFNQDDKRPTQQAKALLRFNAEKGDERKERGMAWAAANRASALEVARSVARELAMRSPTWETNADEVQRVLAERYGWTAGVLGAAAGSIFRGSDWQFTGNRVRSEQVRNHARELKVWRYLGAPAPEREDER